MLCESNQKRIPNRDAGRDGDHDEHAALAVHRQEQDARPDRCGRPRCSLASRSPRCGLAPIAGRYRSANADRATFSTPVTLDNLHRDRDLSPGEAARAPPRDEPRRPRAELKPTMRTAHRLTHSVPRALVSRSALKIGIRRPVHRVTHPQPPPSTGRQVSAHDAPAARTMVKEPFTGNSPVPHCR